MRKNLTGWDAVLESHLDSEQRRKLSEAHIGIAGAGGLGSNVAMMLARSGIGHMTVADFDVVSLSNLNRQQYFPRHLHQPKVTALAEQLLELNPDLDLSIHQIALDAASARELFATCDPVVEAVDDPVTKRLLVESMLAAGHHVIAASGMAGWGGLPMTTRKIGRLTIAGDHATEVAPEFPPLAPRVIMAAALQADAVLVSLLGSGADSL